MVQVPLTASTTIPPRVRQRDGKLPLVLILLPTWAKQVSELAAPKFRNCDLWFIQVSVTQIRLTSLGFWDCRSPARSGNTFRDSVLQLNHFPHRLEHKFSFETDCETRNSNCPRLVPVALYWLFLNLMYYEYDTECSYYSIKICLVAPCDRQILRHTCPPTTLSTWTKRSPEFGASKFRKCKFWSVQIRMPYLLRLFHTKENIKNSRSQRNLARDLKFLHQSGINVRVRILSHLIPFLQPTLHYLTTLVFRENDDFWLLNLGTEGSSPPRVSLKLGFSSS